MNKNRKRTDYRSDYATQADLCHAIIDDINVLYLLAFLLTTNHAEAEDCIHSAADQALNSTRVFKEWVTPWIRRAVIVSAITKVCDSSSRSKREPDRWFSGRDQFASAVDAITQLPDLERSVFVMSILEGYSVHECSLLLRVPRVKIIESRRCALRDLPTVPQTDGEFSGRRMIRYDNAGLSDDEYRSNSHQKHSLLKSW